MLDHLLAPFFGMDWSLPAESGPYQVLHDADGRGAAQPALRPRGFHGGSAAALACVPGRDGPRGGERAQERAPRRGEEGGRIQAGVVENRADELVNGRGLGIVLRQHGTRSAASEHAADLQASNQSVGGMACVP